MADRRDHGPPYATACLIYRLAETPYLKPYVYGRMALGGIDSRAPADVWLDTIYAIVAEAPGEKLEKINEQLVIHSARMRPDRETWGALPEHQALMRKTTGERAGTTGAAPKAK